MLNLILNELKGFEGIQHVLIYFNEEYLKINQNILKR